ncbi:hypothetical protein CC86DRAFT_283953 [Ophiobolus disseminans]|uniref:Uncharacterized protein n=1 Tax=Ophiobolus disseminans TaxID=1469910 RepID=A0A6A7AE20_9PLEO|nr:hypothetical protein CC86DRAFT_283953 [Ophiobolus disseminans]
MFTQPAYDAPAIPHFLELLHQSKALIETHGPYTTHPNTTVFQRAPISRNSAKEVSAKVFASSLATAQDCMNSAQAEGPAIHDLALFKELWDATLVALREILEIGNLDHETFGWGILGLSAGYMDKPFWKDNTEFLSLKNRLRDALMQMPNMDTPKQKKSAFTMGPGGKIGIFSKTNRDIHVYANLLLQQFKREEWARIRWYHGVAVVERWIEHLGWEPEGFESQEEC